MNCLLRDLDAEMPAAAPPPRVANNGDNDVATDNTPSQFILFRGLESSVTEELFAKGVAKLYKQSQSDNQHTSGEQQPKGVKPTSSSSDANSGAREGSLRRVLLVRDRRTNESWKFGFAEFATVDVRCLRWYETAGLTLIGYRMPKLRLINSIPWRNLQLPRDQSSQATSMQEYLFPS